MTITIPKDLVLVDLVLVGGVPGAGKSTAIRAVGPLAGVTVLDPDHVRVWLAARLPAGLPYRSYRLLVHLVHTARVIGSLWTGPLPGRTLVVHDPGTRGHSRPLFSWLAKRRGWRTASLWIDVDRRAAQDGQVRRGRVVRRTAFERHWRRWQRLRPTLSRAADGAHVIVVSRSSAAAALMRLCRPTASEPLRSPDASGAWGRAATPSAP
jgi:predicted kinase